MYILKNNKGFKESYENIWDALGELKKLPEWLVEKDGWTIERKEDKMRGWGVKTGGVTMAYKTKKEAKAYFDRMSPEMREKSELVRL